LPPTSARARVYNLSSTETLEIEYREATSPSVETYVTIQPNSFATLNCIDFSVNDYHIERRNGSGAWYYEYFDFNC
jgi:hypothetical protein